MITDVEYLQQLLLENELKLLIVIATYNEIENLPKLVGRLHDLLPQAHLLAIDDNSPDGTADWCREFEAEHEFFDVVVRAGKLGLGSATILGFKLGLERQFDLIATMDADFSHDPESLVGMVEAIRSRDDVGIVLGSRYVDGGGVEGWPVHRRVASRVVNFLARMMLRLKTADNSGAFRVYRRQSLETIDVEKMKCEGYAYLEEIIWRANHAAVKIVEHPIVFKDRTEGQSKASIGIGLKVLGSLVRMAFSKP